MLLFVVHPVGSASADHSSHNRTIAIIPARYQSTRFPGKPLAELAGKPLIEHVYRRTAACRVLDAVMVATDDNRIADAVRGFGGLVRMTGASHRSGTDRLAEVARTLDHELIVNVQGDEPLIEPAMIEQALTPLLDDPSLVMSTLRRRFEREADVRDPNVVKVVVDRRGFALYFSRSVVPFVRDPVAGSPRDGDSDLRPFCYKHIGLYVYRRHFLLALAELPAAPLERAEALEQLRALEHGYRILAVETAYDSIGVDTPEDLERVRQLMAAGARS
jgi:3-deoxy-manno-octulosonate cytidylyltransferase (CMP-KDO synthetase)